MSDFQYTKPELKKINDMIEECVESLMRQDGEVEFRKDVVARAKDDVAMKPALFNMLVKQRLELKSSSLLEKHEEVVSFDEQLKASANFKG